MARSIAGKRPEGQPPAPSSIGEICPPRPTVDSLIRATPGSPSLDLNSTIAVILTPDIARQAIPTGIWGPVPLGTLGLILGRSGNTLKGLTVLPGVIDSDYEGEVKVILECNHVMQITPGQRIAQILLLPYVQQGDAFNRKGGMKGLGSSDIYWIHEIRKTRPMINLRIEEKQFKGLVDTGADVLSAKNSGLQVGPR